MKRSCSPNSRNLCWHFVQIWHICWVEQSSNSTKVLEIRWQLRGRLNRHHSWRWSIDKCFSLCVWQTVRCQCWHTKIPNVALICPSRCTLWKTVFSIIESTHRQKHHWMFLNTWKEFEDCLTWHICSMSSWSFCEFLSKKMKFCCLLPFAKIGKILLPLESSL